jgi:hypothetical protein
MNEPAKRSAVVDAPVERRWWPAPTVVHVYVACAHKRGMAVEPDEALYVAGDAADRFWCPNCRRKRT